ncbi:uncharacterized protein LOC126845882 [Adelges cooleyi]|uniref:uncharacterized protein LOC126845882 n=1 Tax=Adelges cooleyi TaxID=133065 RepID=UPI00217F467A|nr:uncharacterized protein LOC126845882 [Adelges cooleyi]
MRMLRERYEITNILFKNCMDDSKANTQCRYPREIDRLLRELRCLTNEVKTHYSANALCFVVESAAILVTSVTVLAVNFIYTPSRVVDYKVFIITVSRLIMFFLFIQEAHSTLKPAKQTVLIAHEALTRTNNAIISKELDTLILNCWNHPIVLDVHNLFELDYQLIHSIFAAVVTYTVVFVQIQLAFFERATKTNHTIVLN